MHFKAHSFQPSLMFAGKVRLPPYKGGPENRFTRVTRIITIYYQYRITILMMILSILCFDYLRLIIPTSTYHIKELVF